MRKIALFDKPLPYDKIAVENGWYIRFETPKGQKITMTCYIVENPIRKDKDGPVRIDPPRSTMFLTFMNASQPQDPFGMTGTGEEIPIFSTVVKATYDLFDSVRDRKDGELTVKFEAKEEEPGRIKLYDRMSNALARTRGGEVESYDEYGERHYLVVFMPKRPEIIID